MTTIIYTLPESDGGAYLSPIVAFTGFKLPPLSCKVSSHTFQTVELHPLGCLTSLVVSIPVVVQMFNFSFQMHRTA